MTREELEKKIESGFDEKVINDNFSMLLLIFRAAEQINNDVIDYLTEFNLNTHNFKYEINGVQKRIQKLAAMIMPTFKDGIENKINFFKDYDEFFKLIEDFRDDTK
jgi:phenylacetate-coenzyme A ligase PaaK-like adenylate-forming protein